MKRVVSTNITLVQLDRAVRDTLSNGEFTINMVARIGKLCARELYKRDPEALEEMFFSVKREYYRYWNEFKSPAALRRKREAELGLLNQESVLTNGVDTHKWKQDVGGDFNYDGEF